jgi:hypothetical protein
MVIDVGGDLPAVLGVPDRFGPGVVDLLLSAVPVTVEALGRGTVQAVVGGGAGTRVRARVSRLSQGACVYRHHGGG